MPTSIYVQQALKDCQLLVLVYDISCPDLVIATDVRGDNLWIMPQKVQTESETEILLIDIG